MSDTTATAKRWGARSIVSLVLFVLATVLCSNALVAHWGHRTVIDSQRYLDTVGPLIEQPEVQEALATAVTDRVVAEIDTQSQVSSLLGNLNVPSGLSTVLSAPIATGINSLIGELVTKFIASDQFAKVWITLNTAAQRGIVAILEGGNEGPVQIKGDQIVLDISTALAAIQQHVVDAGITAAANITIPENDRQIELATVSGLGQIRFIYALTSPILQWFPLIVAAMFALSIALARRRARTVVATGIAVVGSALLVALVLTVGQEQFVNQLQGTVFGPASNVFWDTLFSYLILGTRAIFWLGVIVIVAGWFGGRTAIARRLRGHVVKGLDELGDRLTGMAEFRAAVGRHAPLIRWAIYIVVGLFLILSDLASPTTVFWCAALAAGLITAVQVLADVPDEGAADAVDDAALDRSTSSMPAVGSSTTE